jgi:hypothetical protein
MTSLQGASDIVHISGASPLFNQFVADTRMYLRDFAELNRLVAGVESSDRMIAFCAVEAISDFNTTPPNLGLYNFSSFVQKGWVSMLRIGTIINVLTSVGILQTRNHLPFSDGGLNVSVSDKTPLLQSWIQLLSAKWEGQKQSVKISENIAQLLNGQGGVASELFDIHGYYAEVY